MAREPQTPYTKDSEQIILNKSFDPAYNVLAVMQLVEDETTNTLKRAPAPLLDKSYDYIGFTNADANGNYQTITFKSGGSSGIAVRTLNLTYDGNSNVTSIERS